MYCYSATYRLYKIVTSLFIISIIRLESYFMVLCTCDIVYYSDFVITVKGLIYTKLLFYLLFLGVIKVVSCS